MKYCNPTFLKSMATLLVIMIALLMPGCSGGSKMSELQKYIQQVRAEPPQAAPPIPEIKPYRTFKYASADLPSPFQPPIVVSSVDLANQPDTKRPKEVLESFPLDGLHLVGIMRLDGKVWAVIKAPNGLVYRVTVGNYMGQHFGQIQAISPNKIVLTEIMPNPAGGWSKHTTEMQSAASAQVAQQAPSP